MIYQTLDYNDVPIWVDPSTGQNWYSDPGAVAPAAAPASAGFDVSPFQRYLQYAGGSGDIAGTIGDEGILKQDWLSNPSGLFDIGYNQGNRRSLNPYYSTQNRDALRTVAQKLGLSSADADRLALQVAQQNFNQYGQGYTDATSPQLIADQIARQIYQQAGQNYNGLTPEQQQNYLAMANARQQANKDRDSEAWKQDDWGGLLATIGESGQVIYEGNREDPERALVGAQDPFSTKLWNELLNKDWDPTISETGGPTNQTYENAARDGVNTNAASTLQWTADNFAKMYGGGIAGGAMGAGFEALGASEAAASAMASGAMSAGSTFANGGDWEKAFMTWLLNNGGNLAGMTDMGGGTSEPEIPSDQTTFGDNYGQGDYDGYAGNEMYGGSGTEYAGGTDLGGEATLGTPPADNQYGNLYASNDTGTLTDAAPDAGTTGGNMWDDEGNWIDGGSGDPLADQLNQNQQDQGLTDPYSDSYTNDLNQQFGGEGGGSFDFSKLGNLGGLLKLLGGGGGTGGTAGATGGSNPLLSLLGAGVGAMGATNLANKYDAMSKRYEGFGAPYRDRLQQLYANPDSFLQSKEVTSPVQQGTDALMRSLSVQGNPFGSGTALQRGQDYASNQLFSRLGEEKNRLGQFGGLQGYAMAAPGAASKAADAGAGVYNAAGYGLDQAFNPQPTLADNLKALKAAGLV